MALSTKQRQVLELLTCGKGLLYKEIAEEANVNVRTLHYWRTQVPEFIEELNRLNEIRWQAAEDAARQGAIKLCKDGNQKMIEFVLKNAGYNPTTKVEANVNTEINITIGGDNLASNQP